MRFRAKGRVDRNGYPGKGLSEGMIVWHRRYRRDASRAVLRNGMVEDAAAKSRKGSAEWRCLHLHGLKREITSPVRSCWPAAVGTSSRLDCLVRHLQGLEPYPPPFRVDFCRHPPIRGIRLPHLSEEQLTTALHTLFSFFPP